jgi:hypothetical protein
MWDFFIFSHGGFHAYAYSDFGFGGGDFGFDVGGLKCLWAAEQRGTGVGDG